MDFNDEESTVNEADDNGETPTVKHLKNQKARTLDQVKNDGQKYIINKKDDGTTEILTKDFKETERHPITKDEIEEIIARKNTVKEKKPVVYTFNDQNELLKNGKKIPSHQKVKFIKVLNTAADKVFGKGEVHYKFEPIDDENFKNTILVNTTKWDDSDELDPHRFDTAEYKRVESEEDKNKLLGLFNTVAKNVTSKKKKNVIGYDYEKQTFTTDGKPMTDEQLKKFIMGLNGGIKDASDSNYWEHFKISIKGSKVGDIANFSLPPVETCNKESPCITDGCYAVKAYGMYPASRVAMDVNLALLREGRFDQFKEELNKVLKKVYKKTVGKMLKGDKINYFRFHVSGDAFSPEYFNAMCDVARANPDIGFWTYTKQYAILDKCKGNIPDNMSVLVSCWGDFRPKLYKEGRYADLEKEFPLAYLDDGSEEMKNYIDTKDGKGEPFVCPCTDYAEAEVHCNSCLRCYETTKIMTSNLIFKKH